MSIKGLLLLWFGIAKMLIQGLLLLWSGIAGIMIKGLLQLRSGIEMSIKGLLLHWFGFVMSIEGLLLLRSGFATCKKSTFRVRLYLIGASWSHYFWDVWFSFAHSWFELYQEKFNRQKIFLFWETFDFWNLEVLKFLFQILRLWNLEIFTWNLELKIWKKFYHEISGLNFFKTEDLSLKFGHWECEIENLGMKILNWKFGFWKILENFEKELFIYLFFGLIEST